MHSVPLVSEHISHHLDHNFDQRHHSDVASDIEDQLNNAKWIKPHATATNSGFLDNSLHKLDTNSMRLKLNEQDYIDHSSIKVRSTNNFSQLIR